MASLSKHEKDDGLMAKAQALTIKEPDVKYRKQYESLLKMR